MKMYVFKKILWYIVTGFAVIIITFFIPRMMPGNVLGYILTRIGSLPGGQTQVEAFIRQFGLDKPIVEQFFSYLVNLFHGNLGPSLAYYPRSVSGIILNRLPWTIGLMGTATILSWIIGNLLGAIAGFNPRSKLSTSLLVAAISLNQIPYFILGIALVFLLAYTIPLFPTSGSQSLSYVLQPLSLGYIIDILYHAFLPALSIILVSFGNWLVSMRSLIVSILGSDYLLFAEAKGLTKNKILMKYAFRNSLLPQITGLGLSLGFIMSGSLLCEIVFSYPGIGNTFYNAMMQRDYPLMQGILLLTMISVLTVNLIVDLIYPLIDPRTRTTGVE